MISEQCVGFEDAMREAVSWKLQNNALYFGLEGYVREPFPDSIEHYLAFGTGFEKKL